MKKIIFIILIIILFNFLVLYFHELSHFNAGKEKGINFTISLIPEGFFGSGARVTPNTLNDVKAYNELNLTEKADINLAGIKSDLFFSGIILILLLVFCTYLIRKYNFSEKEIIILILLIFFLIILVYKNYNNIFHPKGDVYAMFYNLTFNKI